MQKLQNLPKIDKLLSNPIFKGLNTKILTKIARDEIAELRAKLLNEQDVSLDINLIATKIKNIYESKTSYSLEPLVNATGVILHTNLGRSCINEEIFDRAKSLATGFSNLEFDLKNGKRGERYTHIVKLMKTFLDVEDVLVVNNNASAVFLVLNTFAKKREVVVSRGELVEIGGSFRVPDVMRESGAKLKEIGTTNKTKLKDYENAINKKTSMLMKVHKSNFAIKGFSEEVELKDIVELAKKHKILDYYDAGGSYIGEFGVQDAHLDIEQILSLKPSLFSFSGDKLFGSVQAGIIVGKKELISKLKQNQLLRMLRVDKITLALLEATIKAYIDKETNKIPTISLMRRDMEELKRLTLRVSENLPKKSFELVKTTTYVGGGTMPDKTYPSLALAVDGDAKKLQKIFRDKKIIGRIENEKFLLDFKSILEKDLPIVKNVLEELLCVTSS